MSTYYMVLRPTAPFQGGVIFSAQATRDILPTAISVHADPPLPPEWAAVIERMTTGNVHQLMVPVSADLIDGLDLQLEVCRQGEWIRLLIGVEWVDPVVFGPRPRWWQVTKRIRRWWRRRYPALPPAPPDVAFSVTILGRTV